jgi:excisionase family DNA binding protein
VSTREESSVTTKRIVRQDDDVIVGGDVHWLPLGQAAKYVGVAERTLRKWADEGRLPAFSTPGGHRRFRLTDLDAFLHDARVPSPKASRKPLVLVIDDDERRRGAVCVGMEAEGCEVREATSPEEAFAAVEDVGPDLILLNVLLEDVDGLELLCRLRELHDLEAVSVIMYAGGGVVDRGDDGPTVRLSPPQPIPLIDAAKRVVGTTPGD